MEPGPKNSHFGSQNTPKWNISQITAQKLPKTDVNHISACFCKYLGSFDTIYIQQYQNIMQIMLKKPYFWPQNSPNTIFH